MHSKEKDTADHHDLASLPLEDFSVRDQANQVPLFYAACHWHSTYGIKNSVTLLMHGTL